MDQRRKCAAARPRLVRALVALMVAALLGGQLAHPHWARGGAHDGVRDTVRTKKKKDEKETKEKQQDKHDDDDGAWSIFADDDDCDECCDDCDDDDDGSLYVLGAIVVSAAVTCPYWGPYRALGDSYSVDRWYVPYPYRCEQPGYMTIDPVYGKPVSARTWQEYGADFSNDVDRLQGGVLVEGQHRFGLDARWAYLTEETPTGDDELFQGVMNLTFQFAHNEFAQFRSGIGVRMLSDDIDDEFGFNFTYGFDLYPGRPWIISTIFDLGTLGEATVTHARVTVGLNWKRAEIYTGYDYLKIGDIEIDGPVAGVRIWF